MKTAKSAKTAAKRLKKGGAREGAGRKPLYPEGSRKLLLTFPLPTLDALAEIAATRGEDVTAQDLVREAVDAWLSAR